MKRNAIARIIIYSLILVILLVSLVCGIAAGTFAVRVDYDSEIYTLGSGETPASTVKDIEIEWAAGSITIETGETDMISFCEVGAQDSEPMIYRQNSDKLTIQYQASKVFFGFPASPSKDLIITVPQNWKCGELTVEAASADLTINNLTAHEVELNMASGNSTFTECTIFSLSLDCASGEVYYKGSLNNMDCNTASGKVTAVFDNFPKSLEFDGASADLELTLPREAGFTVELDSISGTFHSDFETIRQDGKYICGDGRCQIDVDGVSGNVTIHKGPTAYPETYIVTYE